MRHALARSLCMLGLLCLLLLAATSTATAATQGSWPGWRGDGDAVSRETNLPTQWDRSTNIRWKTRLAGEGNSSPIVWRDRVFVASATDKGAMRHIVCLNAADGSIIWTADFPRTIKTKSYPKTGFAASTPVTDGRRVYAFFDTPGLVAVDMTGKPAWPPVNLGPFESNYNMAASPVLCGDKVVVICDHGGASFLAAVDKATGALLWKTPRDTTPNSTTPTVITVDGKRQIVVPGPTTIAYDETGAELWRVDGMKPYVTPTGLFDHGRMYITSGRNGPTMAIDPTGRGNITKTHVTMHLATGGPYVVSPVIYSNLLILTGDNGAIQVVNADDQVVLSKRITGRFTASPVAGDGKIYWTDEKGRTHVLAVDTETDPLTVEVVSVNPIGEKVLASPAIAGGRIYIRGAKTLLCIAGEQRAAADAPKTAMPDTFAELAALYEANRGSSRTWAGEGEEEAAVRLEIIQHMTKTIRTAEAAAFIGKAADKDPHWDVREEAAKSLGLYGADAEAPCIHLLTVRDRKGRQTRPYQRIIAADHLGAMESAAATDALLANIADSVPEIRVAVVKALGPIARAHESKRARIIDALIKAMDDENTFVVRAAVDAIAVIGDNLGAKRNAVVARITAIAADDDRLAAEAAVKALKALE